MPQPTPKHTADLIVVSPGRGPAGRVGATFTLTGADGKPYASQTPGVLGGWRRGRIYGRLDCPSALRAIRNGGYVQHRVFFADEETAIAAGYRPCGNCLRTKCAEWKAAQGR